MDGAQTTWASERLPDGEEATCLWKEFCRTRDGDAFELLYRGYRARVFRCCRASVGDDAAADELTTDLFYRLCLNPQPARKGFDAMLFSWVSKLCLRHRRRAKSTSLSDGFVLAAEHPAPVSRGGELRASLRRALHRLSDLEQLVLLLHALEGFSFTDTAAMLLTSRWRVSRLYTRAVGRMQGALGGP
jgi:RNA polymerase sigma factor (sigma-70 family)